MTDRPSVALITAAEDSGGNIGDRFIELAIRRLLGDAHDLLTFPSRRTPGDDEIAALNACDAAVLCGTNLYQDAWQSAFDPSMCIRRQQVEAWSNRKVVIARSNATKQSSSLLLSHDRKAAIDGNRGARDKVGCG